MCRHDYAIGAQVYIGLQVCEAHLDRSGKSSKAVLGCFLGTATVRERQRCIMDQEPVGGRSGLHASTRYRCTHVLVPRRYLGRTRREDTHLTPVAFNRGHNR